jgi:DNA polymerase-4
MAMTTARPSPIASANPRAPRETTFEHDLTAPDDIEAGVAALAANVWAWCAKAGACGRTVTVKVKFADQVTRSRSFPTAIARHEVLQQASVGLVRTLLPTEKGIRLLGVTVSNFDRMPINAAGGLPLFDTASSIAPRAEPTSDAALEGAH